MPYKILWETVLKSESFIFLRFSYFSALRLLLQCFFLAFLIQKLPDWSEPNSYPTCLDWTTISLVLDKLGFHLVQRRSNKGWNSEQDVIFHEAIFVCKALHWNEKKSAVGECSEVNSYFALHKIIGSLPFISVDSCITQPSVSELCETSETLINQCELCFKTTIYLCMCVYFFWKCSTMFKSIFGLQLRQFLEYLRTLFIISVSFPVTNGFWHIPYL